jgi:hypothetical protein
MDVIRVCYDAGFFSCCAVRLCQIIKFFNKNNKLPSTVDSSGLWGKYKDRGDTDITNYFFADSSKIKQEVEEVDYCDEQFSNYDSIDINKIKKFIKKYFSPSEEVVVYQNFLLNKYNINLNKTISVFYRAHDKIFETSVPGYQDMIGKIRELKEKNKDHRVLVQSADPEFCKLVSNEYEDTIVFEEIMKFDGSIMQELGTLVPEGQRKNQALIFLSIILIISNSSRVILNSGNIGLWIVFLRGSIHNVHQYLNGRWLDFMYQKHK